MEISMPKGARNMPQIPMIMHRDNLGMEQNIPSKFSIFRLSSCCSAVPTDRNMRLLATAWNTMIMIAVHAAS